MKIDLEDLTFLFPVKPDSIIRIENLLATSGYILRNFNTKLSVLEVSNYNNRIISKLLNRKIEYSFIEDKDPIFHRTKYRNLMANKVETPFLAVWDVDILADKSQIVDTIERLRQGEADVAYPYNGRCYETSMIIRSLYMKKPQMKILHQNLKRMNLMYGENVRGGAFIANTEKYRLSGMENENFYGWGPEDFERYERWKNINYKIYFSPGCLYHLTHPRDKNGHFNSQRQMEITQSELAKTRKSSFEELIENANQKQ